MKNVMTYLQYLADVNGITIIVTDQLDEYESDKCIPAINTIIINENYATKVDVAFRLAHELSHLIFGSRFSDAIYSFSIGSNRDAEREANINALKILCKYLYTDTPLEYRNYVNFMNEFGLPASMENMVKDAILAV